MLVQSYVLILGGNSFASASSIILGPRAVTSKTVEILGDMRMISRAFGRPVERIMAVVCGNGDVECFAIGGDQEDAACEFGSVICRSQLRRFGGGCC